MKKIKLFLVKSYSRYDDYACVQNKIVSDIPQLSHWMHITDEQYELLKDQEIRNRFIPDSYIKDKKSLGHDYSVIMVEPLEVAHDNLIKILDPLLEAAKVEKEKRKKLFIDKKAKKLRPKK